MYAEKITDQLLANICKALKTTMTKEQGNAVRLIAQECDFYEIKDARMVAYILGTVYNECRFKSIAEIRAKKGSTVWKLQERYWGTGFYGRGFAQITHRKNYQKFSAIVGRDLVKNPNDALIPEVGAKIIVYGMFIGLFTGVGLKKYFTPTKEDWMGARTIVNGKLPGEKYGFMAAECAAAAIKIFGVMIKNP